MSVVVPIPPGTLLDNPLIPPISPKNETIDAVQPADPPPSPTANEDGELLIPLNHVYKWYKYNKPNDIPTNGRVYAK